ncbi:MAG: signal recognition particle-docking protein FtsY [Methylococcus sp.]
MFRNLTLLTLLLTLCVVTMGAYVRISDAGLGCPDWPGCYGKMIVEPPAGLSGAEAAAFDAAKAWKEMTHRYLAGALGLLVLLLCALSFRERENRSRVIGLSFAILLLIVAQALLGMWAVKFHVMPLMVTAHLLTGFLTLWLVYRLSLSTGPQAPPRDNVAGLLWLSRIGLLLLLAQTVLGGWVSSNYAALSCPDFPTCLGSWSPEADYGSILSGIVQPDDYQGRLLPPSARVGIHWLHRLGAVAVFLFLTALALGVTSNRKAPSLSKTGLLLNLLLLIQIALGIALILLRLPVMLAAAHHLMAALMLLSVARIHYFLGLPVAERPTVTGETAVIGLEAIPPVVLPTPVRAPVEPAVIRPVPDEMPQTTPEGLLFRLKSQLGKTRGGLTGFLGSLALGKKAIDRECLDDLEAQLLTADIGVAATREIIDHLTESLDRQELADVGVLKERLRAYLREIILPVSAPLQIPEETRPFVILVVGVNGVGKTTTIGKLAKRLQNQGHSVMLAAGDTFRAAAVEQLQTWGERNQVPVIAQHTGADSASVVYDALQAAQARGVDVLIADTAGRLHNKSHLMEELSKVKRIMARLDETAPHEVLLVLDAGTGQNAINQARQFQEAVGLTGIALTKLDGTAKGGVLFALAKQFGIPIRFIGIGEGIDDLQDFQAEPFIDALFDESSV